MVGILKKLTCTTNTNFVKSKVKHGVYMYKTFYILVYGLAYLCETSLFEMEIKIPHILEHATFLKFNVKN
jgi:hypothetical protein